MMKGAVLILFLLWQGVVWADDGVYVEQPPVEAGKCPQVKTPLGPVPEQLRIFLGDCAYEKLYGAPKAGSTVYWWADDKGILHVDAQSLSVDIRDLGAHSSGGDCSPGDVTADCWKTTISRETGPYDIDASCSREKLLEALKAAREFVKDPDTSSLPYPYVTNDLVYLPPSVRMRQAAGEIERQSKQARMVLEVIERCGK